MRSSRVALARRPDWQQNEQSEKVRHEMRCFFNLVDVHNSSILDVDGVDVADMDELGAVVADAVEEVRQEHPSDASDWKGWRLEVTDTAGAVLVTINLDPASP